MAIARTIRIAPSGAGPSPAALAKAEALKGPIGAGRYRADQVLACGDTRAVLRGVQLRMQRSVVIKVVYGDAPPEEASRLEQEAVALARVRHENVAAAIDFGLDDGGAWHLVTEHVAGPSLGDLFGMTDRGKLTVAKSLRIARQIASALVAMHEARVVYGAIEASSVLLSGPHGDDVRLVGFGRAKADPESFDDDVRADLFALGVLLYEMLAGKPPFAPGDPATAEAKPLPVDLGAHASLEAVVMRLVRRDPLKRYATATEALQALDSASSPSPPPSSSPHPSPPPSSSAPARPPLERAQSIFQRAISRARQNDQARAALDWIKPHATIAISIAVPIFFLFIWLLVRCGSSPSTSPAASASAAPSSAPVAASESTPSNAVVVSPSGTAPSTTPSAEADGMDAATARARLREVNKTRDWNRAGKAVEALVAQDPAALREPDIVASIVAVAVALETTGGAAADSLFDALSDRAGESGLDILFEIVRTRGGTRGSKRAADILRKPEIAERATPGLRVAFALRDAPCDGKPALYDRVVAEGDERSVTELRVLRESKCERRRKNQDACCYDHEPLDKAIDALRDRLKNK